MTHRQIESLRTMKRLEDQRMETTVREHLNLSREISRFNEEINRLELEIVAQAENTGQDFAPFLATFIRSARTEIDRLTENRDAMRKTAAELEGRVMVKYRKSRMLERTAEILDGRIEKMAALADAENELDELTRHRPDFRRRPCSF